MSVRYHRDHLQSRSSRLLLQLSRDAPTTITAEECRLYLASIYGGHLRAIFNLTRILISSKVSWYFHLWIGDPTLLLLCHLGYHHKDMFGNCECQYRKEAREEKSKAARLLLGLDIEEEEIDCLDCRVD